MLTQCSGVKEDCEKEGDWRRIVKGGGLEENDSVANSFCKKILERKKKTNGTEE